MPIEISDHDHHDSDSDESTAASFPQANFKCALCWRTFDSGQALGGHQNAHRFEREEKRAKHHELAHAHFQAAKWRLFPPTLPPPPSLFTAEPKVEPPFLADRRILLGQPRSSAILGTGFHYHVYNNKPRLSVLSCQDDHDHPVVLTNDFLGEWMPIYNIGGKAPAEEEEAARSSERTESNSDIGKGLKGLGGEEVSSRKNNEEVDLELRLWF